MSYLSQFINESKFIQCNLQTEEIKIDKQFRKNLGLDGLDSDGSVVEGLSMNVYHFLPHRHLCDTSTIFCERQIICPLLQS